MQEQVQPVALDHGVSPPSPMPSIDSTFAPEIRFPPVPSSSSTGSVVEVHSDQLDVYQHPEKYLAASAGLLWTTLLTSSAVTVPDTYALVLKHAIAMLETPVEVMTPKLLAVALHTLRTLIDVQPVRRARPHLVQWTNALGVLLELGLDEEHGGAGWVREPKLLMGIAAVVDRVLDVLAESSHLATALDALESWVKSLAAYLHDRSIPPHALALLEPATAFLARHAGARKFDHRTRVVRMTRSLLDLVIANLPQCTDDRIFSQCTRLLTVVLDASVQLETELVKALLEALLHRDTVRTEGWRQARAEMVDQFILSPPLVQHTLETCLAPVVPVSAARIHCDQAQQQVVDRLTLVSDLVEKVVRRESVVVEANDDWLDVAVVETRRAVDEWSACLDVVVQGLRILVLLMQVPVEVASTEGSAQLQVVEEVTRQFAAWCGDPQFLVRFVDLLETLTDVIVGVDPHSKPLLSALFNSNSKPFRRRLLSWLADILAHDSGADLHHVKAFFTEVTTELWTSLAITEQSFLAAQLPAPLVAKLPDVADLPPCRMPLAGGPRMSIWSRTSQDAGGGGGSSIKSPMASPSSLGSTTMVAPSPVVKLPDGVEYLSLADYGALAMDPRRNAYLQAEQLYLTPPAMSPRTRVARAIALVDDEDDDAFFQSIREVPADASEFGVVASAETAVPLD
ncbi:hypothetical protein AMAG_02987 [Allomyces macrogynus ATCC 38327]|uniref:Uncharacterized protein n=1 Tax=Allomyces macrogynus (strain ATCC 38327) TaxID=578462 RepID=A0A0L0S3X5_ALLM3|nr:hypothetical protein AMAG_02987 [Allomyces macrogynus ATCC 38327]|eukprot:KNE57253.1 hypothetical protein AMAG_02987 [Allomyces macrogynus ATCC 38327]